MENLRGFARIILKGYMAFTLSVFASLFFSCSPAFADPTPNTSTPTISIASDGLITYANQPEVFNSGSEQITVTTNNYTGYRLMISTSTTVLTNEDDSQFTISPITLPTGEVSVTNQNFGYGYGITFDNINYRPVTSDFLGSGIEIGSADTSGTETYTLGFGSKIDYSTPNGSYSNVFVLTGIPNPSDSTISYNENAGTDTVSNMPSEPTHGDCEGVVVLSNATPTRAHYHFLGWSRNADATVATYQPGDTITLDPWENNSNIGLYAIWEPYTASIVFHKNDEAATGTMADQTLSYGLEQTLNKNTFEKEGYTLVGWTTTEDGSGTIYYNRGRLDEELINSDGQTIDLYGVWVESAVGNFAALGDCVFGGAGVELEGSCRDYSSAEDYIRTDTKVYSRENLHRSFYTEFTLQDIANERFQNNYRDTIMSTILEDASYNYPGTVFRIERTNWQIRGNRGESNTTYEKMFNYDVLAGKTIHFYRFDDGVTGHFYYQIDDGAPIEIFNYDDQYIFDTILTYGANLDKNNENPDRFFIGTLRDIRFKFTDDVDSLDEIINISKTDRGIDIDYSELETVFSQPGLCIFNDKNNITGDECTNFTNDNKIDTGINLFSAENIEKDFIVEFQIDEYVPSNQINDNGNAQNTLFAAMAENSSIKWPGIVFRKNSNSLEFVANTGGTSGQVNKAIKINLPVTKVRIIRQNQKICYSVNDGANNLYNTFKSLVFDSSAVFGAAIDGNNNYFRHFTGQLSHMSIKLGHIGNDISKYVCQ